MITRVVKLTFKPEKVAEFRQLLSIYKNQIANFEGCVHLEIFCEKEKPFVFFTYSKWKSEDYLNKYRNSELFEKVWGETKTFFAAKPEAWTLTEAFN